ncbi:hypothetical protein AAG570_011106 [Ranatra chinensis]|uniref:CXXC-type domain-containing protein n=1 Tax=Ranatra chinensis TaxID=642074 RepID=A0ABD0Z7Y7_9HEMI
MSDGGGDGGGYPGGGYPQEPATPSSTVPDGDGGGPKQLVHQQAPPHHQQQAYYTEEGRPEAGDQPTRLTDVSAWDYYGEGLTGRLLDRGDGFPLLVPQPQYRPWESKDHESQFTAFPPEQNGETVSLTTLTAATPAPPSPDDAGLPSFHTLSAVPARGYPLVPAPVQAGEIPGVQQQLLDERHIHLFQSPPQQYHQLGAYQPHRQQATLLTVVKTEPLIVTQLQPEDGASPRGPPIDSRKKERRKMRASSLESSNESDGVGSSSVESSGQVAAVSSTAGFKSPLACHQGAGLRPEDDCHDLGDKPVKKKRKRCGECIGCQRKDNCGDCAPCRNDKSHQICKMRRCEKLTEKKVC